MKLYYLQIYHCPDSSVKVLGFQKCDIWIHIRILHLKKYVGKGINLPYWLIGLDSYPNSSLDTVCGKRDQLAILVAKRLEGVL